LRRSLNRRRFRIGIRARRRCEERCDARHCAIRIGRAVEEGHALRRLVGNEARGCDQERERACCPPQTVAFLRDGWRRRWRNIIRRALAPDAEMFRRQDLFDALQVGLSDGFARADFALSGPDRIVVFRMIVVFRTIVVVGTERRSVGREVRLLFEGILILDRVGLLVKRMIARIWKSHGCLHCLDWLDLTKGPCRLSLLALARLPPFEKIFEQPLALLRCERVGCRLGPRCAVM
jgi:hypothetical protein